MIKLAATIEPLVEYDLRYADGPFNTRVYEARCFLSCVIQDVTGLVLLGEGRGHCVDAARDLAASKVMDKLLSQLAQSRQTSPTVEPAVDASDGGRDGTMPSRESDNFDVNSPSHKMELHAEPETVNGEANNLQSKYTWTKAILPFLGPAAREDAIRQLASKTFSRTIQRLIGTQACARWVQGLLVCLVFLS